MMRWVDRDRLLASVVNMIKDSEEDPHPIFILWPKLKAGISPVELLRSELLQPERLAVNLSMRIAASYLMSHGHLRFGISSP